MAWLIIILSLDMFLLEFTEFLTDFLEDRLIEVLILSLRILGGVVHTTQSSTYVTVTDNALELQQIMII